jgi:hypothetical protein
MNDNTLLDLHIEELEDLSAPIWNANDWIALGIGGFAGGLAIGAIAVGLT